MDNAAKALIIAGGILIGMLIIALSMYMYRVFQDAYVDSMRLHTAYEINSFNSNFTKYGFTSGDSSDVYVMGSDAYNILSKVYDVNNSENSIIDEITISGQSNENPNSGFSLNPSDSYFFEKIFYFSDSFKYKYKYSYGYNNDGVISQITLQFVEK